LILVAAVIFGLTGAAAAAGSMKVAVLKFGTVNWELDVIKSHALDRAEGLEIEVLGLASKNATSVALQAGGADMVVTDWIWVARQRAEGAGFTFVPFSIAAGALMVPGDSPIKDLKDLKGKTLGIAGGPLDKSWLLLQSLTRRTEGFDANDEVDKVFAAPPLLNQQMLAGRLDAVLNFWHYSARLKAAGYRPVLTMKEITRAHGIESDVPLIGYVFDESWAAANKDQVLAFFRATRRAKDILLKSDAEWQRIRPLMKTDEERIFLALRDSYRRGIPAQWGDRERSDAERLFAILAEQGGEKLVGRATSLPDGTFWQAVSY
jgi:NitT/TauT family transport system substrate-binding protein